MFEQTLKKLTGKGAPEFDLTAADFSSIIADALSEIASGSKILAIISDKTRDDNTDLLFPIAAEILADKNISKLDALVAQGTHSPMNNAEKLAKIGAKNLADIPNLQNIFDHEWNNPEKLTIIGELSREKVREISGGLFDKLIPLTINHLLTPGNYDYVLIFGATVPHEVAGFAGGAKYFFPGVSGAELIHATHWLAALATIENIIGRVETPTRRLIEAAADFVSAEVISFTSVSRTEENRLQTHAFFAGDFRLALRKAAEVSRQVHKIDAETCRRVNLNFMDYQKFKLSDYENDADTLIVERAGRDLYLVAP